MISLFRSGAHRLSSHRSHLHRSFSFAAKPQQTAVETLEPSAPSNHRPPPSPLLLPLVDEISSLSQSEIRDLCRKIMEKTGQEPPTIGLMGAGAGAGSKTGMAGPGKEAEEEEKKEEKTVFELKLEGFDAASKIKVIKEVRSYTDLGLKEAKELVEKAPVVIKGGVSKEDGMAIVEKMKAVGAKVVLE